MALDLAETTEKCTAWAKARVDFTALAAPFGRLRAGFEVVPFQNSTSTTGF
jgi:hypothetical protein